MPRQQGARLFDETRGVHGVDTPVERRDQRLPLHRHGHLDRRNLLGRRTCRPLPARDRPSARHPHFEGALDAVPVRRGDLSTTLRVDFRQPGVQPPRPPRPRGDRAQASPDRFVARRHLRQAGQEGSQVEERSTHQDGPLPAPGDVAEDRARPRREIGSVELLLRVDDVDEVMRYACPLFRVRLGAADVEAAVDLDGIEIDDLSTQLLRQLQGEPRLPDAGRAGHDEERRRRQVLSVGSWVLRRHGRGET